MELQQLFHFQKVALLNHMSKAAKELHITQPALSKSIASLEEELGVQLFDRKGKKISLNDTGKDVLEHVNHIETECAMIVRIGLEKRQARDIRILVQAADQLIPEIVFRIGREHPEIKIHVNHYQSHHEPDITITSSLEPYDQDDGKMVLKEEFVLVIPSDHPLADKPSVRLKDLDGEEMIVLAEGIPMREIVNHWLKSNGVRVKYAFECDSCVMMREMINNVRGIALVPSRTWSFSYNSRIRICPLEDPIFRYVNVILHPQKNEAEAKLVYHTVVSYLQGFDMQGGK